MRRTSVLLVAVAASLPLAGACGGGTPTARPVTPTVVTTSPAPLTPSPTTPSPTTPSPATVPPTAPPTQTPPVNRCPVTSGWSTGPVTAPAMSTAELHSVRVGAHPCFDRVVFDVDGPQAVGYAVRYVPVVHSDPKDDPLPVAGGAVLEVVVRAPQEGHDQSGHHPGRVLAGTGDHLYTAEQLAHWSALRAVRFAGFFEGQCTFAVGVRAKLPFRVFTVLNSKNHVRQVVLDVAHA
ncbi:MAG TPA: hypothetical protein VHF06_10660 [Pseudonocardiaceae bacterium]|jgi:hypothetical protein|nr:hypothetical protein [Pseudonocardiaceae bacterium]